MGIAGQMESLSSQIIALRNTRGNYLLLLRQETQEARVEGERARLEAFGQTYHTLQDENKRSREDIRNRMDSYKNQRHTLAKELKQFSQQNQVDKIRGEKERLGNFRQIHTELKEVVKAIRKETGDRLRGFQVERQQMAKHLGNFLTDGRQELAKHEQSRIKNWHSYNNKLKNEVKMLADTTHKLLDEFREDLTKGGMAWKKMSIESPSTDLQDKDITEATKAEVLQMQGFPQFQSEIEKEPGISGHGEEEMKVKILDIINSHPEEGIRIAEIEDITGYARIRIGNIIRSMIEEDKVRKEGLLYIPVSINNK